MAPVVFITVRATEALFAAGTASFNLVTDLINGVPLATALETWQQAILTVLQTPLPPGSGPAAATTLSAAAATPSVAAAAKTPSVAAAATTPSVAAASNTPVSAAGTVASVPATVKTTLKDVATALTPKPQVHIATTGATGTPATGSLLKTATTGNAAAASSSTPTKGTPVGVGHPTGGKTKKN